MITKDIMIIPVSFNAGKGAYADQKVLRINGAVDNNIWYQTNEAPTYFVQKYLSQQDKPRNLEKIYLIASAETRKKIFEDKTTVDLYEEHITSICPELAGCFEVIPYDETKNSFEGDILEISEIAERIRKDFSLDLNINEDINIKIHADMSGGVRDMALVILNIIQFLTLNKDGNRFVSGKIVYANLLPPAQKRDDKRIIEIDDATEIYNTTALIAGAREFIQYGSVQQLQEYLGQYQGLLWANAKREKKKPDSKILDHLRSVGTLLSAMQEFSNVLHLCQPYILENAKNRLQKAIVEFDEKIADCSLVPITMFRHIEQYIWNGYNDVLRSDSTILDVIKWCIDKNYDQQAITFCVELTPRYFITGGLCVPKDDTVKQECLAAYHEMLEKNHRNEAVGDFSDDDELAKYFLFDYLQKRAQKRNGNENKLEMNELIKQCYDFEFTSIVEQDRLIAIMNKYKNMIDYRNNINHAKKANGININTLKKEMVSYIEALANADQGA